MAITTYTFPNQVVPSGTLSFELRTSEGDGTPVTVTEKYFSSEVFVTNETEFVGGDILSNVAKLTIENDVDNLFQDTIFDSLYVDGGWVSVKITLVNSAGTHILFSGIINKQTIKYETYYAQNDALSGRLIKITFLCIWHLDLLKYISAKSIGQYILLDPNLYTTVGALGTKTVTIGQIIYVCLTKLATDYSLTLNLVYSDSKYHFFTQPTEYSTTAPSYAYSGGFRIINTPGVELSMSRLGSPSVTLTNPSGTLFGIFDEEESGGKYIETAYDLFIGILKSFAIYATFRVNNSYDIYCEIGTRSSGSSVNITDVIDQSDDLFSEVARDGVSITSLVDGAKYEKMFNRLGDSIYTNQNAFNFRNDNEFDGILDNSLFSLLTPITDRRVEFVLLIRELGIGDNQLLNGSFETDMSSWTTSDFVRDNSTTPLPFISAKASLSTSVAKTIYQTGTFSEDDYSLFKFYVQADKSCQVSINLYTAAGLHSTTTKTISANAMSLQMAASRRPGTARSRGLGTITKVEISILGLQASTTAWIGQCAVYISRQGTPELYGKMVESYFNNPLLTRKRYVLDGVRPSFNTSDYLIYNGENYYLKKVSHDLVANQTEIEAINYPY